MKRNIINQLIKATSLLTILSLNVSATNLNVKIDNIKNNEGKILAQIFKGKENYKNGKAEASIILPAKKGENQFIFQNLESGEYAVRLFHDANQNNSLDTNLFGMPTEGYGFSNEAVGHFGPAKYKDMAFIISDDDKEQVTQVKMVY